MRQRCRPYTKDKAARYAERGIAVDPRWDSFDTFLSDMGARPPGTTLDRINNDLGYGPDNCRWATPVQQSGNRAVCVTYTHGGATLTSTGWSRALGGGPELVRKRLRTGWPLDAALTTPADPLKATRKIQHANV